ncbi:hypothetical protein MTR67_031593 [Solanum verrucosum]|uniref:Uncharacterized protein n=1 Tax=Solanum verrucosum TaxID=315347 RepID=A0AAF0ZGG4_SOLVR|nr:hypothetical protein MTR67_031593 [Solanum verrucosum]
MLWACVMDFGGQWYQSLPLTELAYNKNYHSSIQVAPFEALYWDSISLDQNLSFGEKPIAILDRQTRQLSSKHIDSVKVQWRHRSIEEVMWEVESDKRRRYPQLFTLLEMVGVVPDVNGVFGDFDPFELRNLDMVDLGQHYEF